VMAHEFGHGTGGLADEYCASAGAYGGAEPGVVDLTINTNRATTKWGNFIAPSTPVPTGTVGGCAGYTAGPKPAGWSDDQDVGLFEGGNTASLGIYRPVINCRMRGNSPPYCPVCYTQMKRRMDPYTQRTFLNCYAGDFNGELTTVVATLRCTQHESAHRVYVISGHYASRCSDVVNFTCDAPGADDDASGVAAVLELARVMAKRDFDAAVLATESSPAVWAPPKGGRPVAASVHDFAASRRGTRRHRARALGAA